MQLFIDIETIRSKHTPKLEQLRKEKYEEKSWESYWLFAEFWKIVCISIWYEHEDQFKIKSLVGDEKQILKDLFWMITKNTILVWHNLIWFDLPFIQKRAIIHWLELPWTINTFWKKPREIKHFDTMLMRKHTSRTNTSLEVLCEILDIESPKDWIIKWANIQEFRDSELKHKNYFAQKTWWLLAVEYFWIRYEVKPWLSEAELKKFYRKTEMKVKLDIISGYCENDVIATYKVFNKLSKCLDL